MKPSHQTGIIIIIIVIMITQHRPTVPCPGPFTLPSVYGEPERPFAYKKYIRLKGKSRRKNTTFGCSLRLGVRARDGAQRASIGQKGRAPVTRALRERHHGDCCRADFFY